MFEGLLQITADSATYIYAARSFFDGAGFLNPFEAAPGVLTHFPPAYPLFLSFGLLLDVDILAWAAWLNLICFGLNAALVALVAFEIFKRFDAAFLAGGSFLVLAQAVEVHFYLLSEPLFFTWMLLSLWMLCRYVNGRGIAALIVAAVAASLCALTRYVGVSVIIAGGVSMALLLHRSKGRRMWPLITFFIMAAGLPLAWSMRNFFLTEKVIGFIPQMRWQWPKHGEWIMDGLSQYLLPASFPWVWRWIVLAGALAAVMVFCMSPAAGTWRQRPAVKVVGIFAGSYFMVLVAAMFFSAGAFSIEHRYFLPLVVVLLPLTGFLAVAARRWRWVGIFVGIFLVLMFCRMAHSIKMVRAHAKIPKMDQSVVDLARDNSVEFFTDDPQRFYLRTGRLARMIPRRDATDLSAVVHYGSARNPAIVILEPALFNPHPAWKGLARHTHH